MAERATSSPFAGMSSKRVFTTKSITLCVFSMGVPCGVSLASSFGGSGRRASLAGATSEPGLDLLQRQDIAIAHVDVEQCVAVKRGGAVPYTFFRHDDAQIAGSRIQGRSLNAAARGKPRQDDSVDAEKGKHAAERRLEERRGFRLFDDRLLRQRRDRAGPLLRRCTEHFRIERRAALVKPAAGVDLRSYNAAKEQHGRRSLACGFQKTGNGVDDAGGVRTSL